MNNLNKTNQSVERSLYDITGDIKGINTLPVNRAELAAAPAQPKRQYYYRAFGCNAVDANDPCCICWYDEGTGPMVGEEDSIKTWRAAPEQPAAPIVASIMCDDGGDAPAFCLMVAYRSENDAKTALAMLTTALAQPASEPSTAYAALPDLWDNEVSAAAFERTAVYENDSRQDIKNDVFNTFCAGANWERLRASREQAPAEPVTMPSGTAYAALPEPIGVARIHESGELISAHSIRFHVAHNDDGDFDDHDTKIYTADQVRAFADATHALRAAYGQAPATQVAPSVLEESHHVR